VVLFITGFGLGAGSAVAEARSSPVLASLLSGAAFRTNRSKVGI
jgi:hypothetical protein